MKRGVRDNLLVGQFQASLTNERFLARLKMYRKNATSTERKKSAQFWLKPTRRIPTSETEGKESWQKKERTFYVWSNFFDKIAKKSLSSDRAGSFGPVLREYWTGNAAIQLADFGGPLIKLSRVWYILIYILLLLTWFVVHLYGNGHKFALFTSFGRCKHSDGR